MRSLGRRINAATLLLVLLSSCLAPSGTRLAIEDDTGRLYSRTYDQIADNYIEPIRASDIALAGLRHLNAVDGKLGVDAIDRLVVITYDNPGQDRIQLAQLPRPGDDDAESWGALTSSALAVSRNASPTIAALAPERLNKVVFDGIVGRLDRFSRYADPDAARDQRAARDGFGGIGVTLDYTNDEIRIADVVADGPAARAGLKVEDRIIEIDETRTATLARTEIVRRLRGRIDTPVRVVVRRKGAPSLIERTVTRGFIVPATVTVKREDDIAIVRISSFNQHTARSLADRIIDVRNEMGSALRGVIIDMRGNPGGLLNQSIYVADLFMKRGPIVSQRGRNPASRQSYSATSNEILGDMPIVVLVNGGSASAAEIVAAALQDSRRAVVLGSASFGKGTVQTAVTLPNDGELTLTWAKLYSPMGYLLHEHGVVPSVCTNTLSEESPDFGLLFRAPVAMSPTAAAGQPRASLDDDGWHRLRDTCPPVTAERQIDVEAAKRLLRDPGLYRAVLERGDPKTARAAQESAAPTP